MRRLLIAIMLLIIGAAPAYSEKVALETGFCVLAGLGELAAEEALARRGEADCSSVKLERATDHLWIIPDIAGKMDGLEVPVLRIPAARLGDYTIHAVYEDAASITNTYSPEAVKDRWRVAGFVSFPLVAASGEHPIGLVIGAERPWDTSAFKEMYLIGEADDIASHQRSRILDSVFIGGLFAPLLLNLVFFMLLRARFILFHSAMLGSFIVVQFYWGGLVFELFPGASIIDRTSYVYVFAAISMGFMALLVRELVAPEKLGPVLHTWLPRIALLPLIATIIVLMGGEGAAYWGPVTYNLATFVTFLTIIASIVKAALNGSSIARLQLLGFSGFAVIALCRMLNALDVVNALPNVEDGLYAAILLEALVMSYIVARRALDIRRERDLAVAQNSELSRRAATDFLTGLNNRQSFVELFDGVCGRIDRGKGVWALLVLDVDHFKTVNDTHGHDGGDLCLRQLALLLAGMAGKDGYCGRFGGEEFVLLVRFSDDLRARVFAERLRRSIADYVFGDETRRIGRITASIGLLCLPRKTGLDFDTCFKAADVALFLAKQSGRNSVEVATLAHELKQVPGGLSQAV